MMILVVESIEYRLVILDLLPVKIVNPILVDLLVSEMVWVVIMGMEPVMDRVRVYQPVPMILDVAHLMHDLNNVDYNDEAQL